MRAFTRTMAFGILLISCSDSITTIEYDPGDPSGPSCAYPDRVHVAPDSLHLVMGAADRTVVQVGCNFGTLPPGTTVHWTMKDSAVASFHDEASDIPSGDEVSRTISPEAPGRTYIVAEVGGRRDSIPVFVPDTAIMGPITELGAGGFASCAVTEGGETWCWGDGSVLRSSRQDPAVGTCWGNPCSPVPVLRVTGARLVFVGETHACSLNGFGKASCWGENDGGKAGSPYTDPVWDPFPLPGEVEFSVLALGMLHSCGLDKEGKAHCWGSSSLGRLGGNQRGEMMVTSPEPVSGDLPFVSLTADRDKTCGATEDGRIFCWGILGDSPYTVPGAERCLASVGKDGSSYWVGCSYLPLEVNVVDWATGDTRFVQVSGNCARTASASVFCFDPDLGRFAPRAELSGMATISAGADHGCGLTDSGSARCWGQNDWGQLGDGTMTFSDGLVSVAGDHSFTQISVGDYHSCGLTTEHEVWCWGHGRRGQAGTSVLSPTLIPVKTRGQG